MKVVNLDGNLEDRIEFTDAEALVIRKAVKSKLFHKGDRIEERVMKFQTMLSELSKKFSVPRLRLMLHQGMMMRNTPGYGYKDNIVVIGRFSLTSILSAFAMHLHHHTENGELTVDDDDFLKAFSLSLFKQAVPRMFKRAKKKGRLVGTEVPYTDGGKSSSEEAGGEPSPSG